MAADAIVENHVLLAKAEGKGRDPQRDEKHHREDKSGTCHSLEHGRDHTTAWREVNHPGFPALVAKSGSMNTKMVDLATHILIFIEIWK